MKQIKKSIEAQRYKLIRKTVLKKSNEELALNEFKTRLGRKGLTPEAFFRTCDTSYRKVISVENFKSNLKNFNLQLSKG